MAGAGVGMIGRTGYVSSRSWIQTKDMKKKRSNNMGKDRVKVFCSYGMDPYKTLRIERGASESEVKKAFRRLALQYHPDVCKAVNSGAKFNQIHEAYDVVMANLRREEEEARNVQINEMMEEDFESWEEWVAWMGGWEGAGIRDYSSFIYPGTDN